MYKNYEARVKDFIIDMNSADTKIEIKDYEERINNPKTDLSVEKDILKPFIFKGYTTEVDRIKDSVKRNRYLYNLPDYDEILDKTPDKRIRNKRISTDKVNDIRKINSSYDDRLRSNSSSNELKSPINKKNNYKIENNNNNNKRARNIKGLSLAEIKKYKYILKNALIMQPEMRFKPRTDLERIYDIVNGYKYGQAKKEILDKQLEKLDMFRYKNRHELYRIMKEKIRESNMNNSNEQSNTDENDESNKKDKSKPGIKREDLNIDALKLLSSYRTYKMHFKAAKEVANNKTKTNENADSEENNNNINNLKSNYNKKIKKEKKSCLLLPNLFRNKPHIISKSSTEGNNLLSNISNLYNKDNKNEDAIDIKIEEDDNKIFNFESDNLKETNEEEKDKFNNIYDKNKNPFKKNIVYDQDKVRLLNDIAFVKNDDEEKIKEDEENNKINFFEENNIIVGNEKLDKNKQFDIITKKILGNCNILKHKSKFNDTTLKKRNGKLMITHGLSINQFEKKYGFK